MGFKALAVANLLMVASIAIFAIGFFPYKPFLPGLAQPDIVQHGETSASNAPFNKLVFMVVDALRR